MDARSLLQAFNIYRRCVLCWPTREQCDHFDEQRERSRVSVFRNQCLKVTKAAENIEWCSELMGVLIAVLIMVKTCIY